MIGSSKKKVRIGIVGCGTIGRQLAKAIKLRFIERARLVALCDLDQSRARELKEGFGLDCRIVSVEKLIKICDLVIEAACAGVAARIARQALLANKDVMIMSVGGILSQAHRLFALAKKKGCRVYIPSGALAGLDAVGAASMSRITKATLITRKPISGLEGAPYLKRHKLDLEKLTAETVIFKGPASQAVKAFPANVNVCAALSLAGLGAKKTMVKIIASPDYKFNSHQVELEGDFGRLLTRTENRPAPENPKTSFLAALSAVATLGNILQEVRIGT